MVTFQVPAGPMNLEPLFPSIDFSQVEEYYLEINTTDGVMATTPVYRKACCCGRDVVRIFFVNYLGGVDAVNFTIQGEDLNVRSDEPWKKSLPYPMEKWDGGFQRFGVTSNEAVTVETTCYQEEDQEWLKELLSTPNAWIQWLGTQSQPDDYLPIVISDGRFVTRKKNDRYTYTMELEFTMANENSTVRN